MATAYYADKEIVGQFKEAMDESDEFLEQLDNSVYPPQKIVVIPASWYALHGITLKKKEEG